MKTFFRIASLAMLVLCIAYGAWGQSWTTEWSNSGNDWIGPWNLHPEDGFLSGSFSCNYGAQILAVHTSGWAMVLYFNQNNATWYYLYSNGGNGWIGPGASGHGWGMNSSDQYRSIKTNYNCQDYLLAVNKSTNHAMMLRADFNPSSGYYYFTTTWSNGGGGTLGGWTLNYGDHYVVGNFTGSADIQELMCINVNGWAMLQSPQSGTSWSQLWNNSGTGSFAGWSIGSNDRFTASDADGDGIDELVCVNPSGGWSAVLKYSGSNWTSIWGNGGNGYLGSWSIGSTEGYNSGSVDTDSKAEFFAVNYGSGWAMLQKYSGSGWSNMWSNGGNWQINGWNISSSDRRLTDAFYSPEPTKNRLILVNPSGAGYASMMRFNPPTPPSVTMSGPTTIYHPQKGTVNQYTWTANVSGGTPPYTYAWTKNGSPVGTNSSTYTEYLSYNGDQCDTYYQFTLRVDVTGGGSAFATKNVTAWNSCDSPNPRVADLGAPTLVLPDGFNVLQNYPNPFNPETEISFGLPEPSSVRITVTDVLGREVVTLADRKYPAGYQRTTWGGKDASGNGAGSGVYFCRFVVEGESGTSFVKVMKMILMK